MITSLFLIFIALGMATAAVALNLSGIGFYLACVSIAGIGLALIFTDRRKVKAPA